MSFSHLLSTEAALANFRVRFAIPPDVNVAYYHEDNIALEWCSQVVLFPLMSILEGGVRLPVDPLILTTLRFYGLWPDQLPPNFYRAVSYVSPLNNLYGLHLDQHDINYMYRLCGKERSGYYLKVRNTRVRLISCLLDSNKNLAGEFVLVSGNWHVNELTCPTLPRNISRYHSCWICVYFVVLYHLFTITFTFIYVLITLVYSHAGRKKFKPDINAVHVQDLNFVRRS